MRAPNDDTAPKGLRGWWASPPRSGMQRIISPWEYRYLRAWAGVAAALVHDIGDSLAPYSHGSYAAAVLRPFVSGELCWIISHHPLFQMYYYGPHMAGDKHAGDQFRGHPWFDATVEFCERYDENCFDPDYDWLPLAHFARPWRKCSPVSRGSADAAGHAQPASNTSNADQRSVRRAGIQPGCHSRAAFMSSGG